MNISWKGCCVVGSIAALTGAAQADDLLLIDLTVPNQITITATDGASAVNASGSDTTGVYFENFYGGAGNALTNSLVSGDITNAENPADNTPSIFRGGGGTDPGLNMWSWSSDLTVSFSAGALAFVGSGTWSLDADEYADMLAGNTSGNLYFPADTADDIANAHLIGTYRVIPTPAAATLFGAGLGFGVLRRRR